MPYFVTEEGEHPDCSGYAVVKDDGELLGCHETKQDAIDQMVAVSISEGIEPGGAYTRQERDTESRELPDNYRPALSEDVPEGRACGNCIFYDESRVNEAGDKAWCERWDDYVSGDYYCNAWRDNENRDQENEQRQVNLPPPAYMRAAARQGLKYYEEGLAGDGLVQRTVREARAMARGSVTAEKWVRIRAWIARHLVDLDSPSARPGSDDYPSPGVVAHLLWGSGPSQSAARTPTLPKQHWFGLTRFRSPLLSESLIIFASSGYLDLSVLRVRALQR